MAKRNPKVEMKVSTGRLKGLLGGDTGITIMVNDDVEGMFEAYERLKYLLEPKTQKEIAEMPEKQRKLLVDLTSLLRGIRRVDDDVANLMTITQKAVEDARSLERGLMELPDGRILVEYVRDNMPGRFQRPTWQ